MKSLKFYSQRLRPHLRVLLLAFVCAIIFGLSSSVGIPVFLGKVFAAFFEGDAMVYGLTPFSAAFLLPVIFAIRGLFGYFNQYLLSRCGQSVLLQIRAELFSKLQELPIRYFDNRASGDLLSRVLGDTQFLQTTLMLLANDAMRQPLQMIGAFGLLVYLSVVHQEVAVLIFLIIIIPFVALPVRYVGRKLRLRGRQAQESLSSVTQQIKENLAGALEVRSFNLQGHEKDRFGGKLGDYFRLQMKQTKYLMMSQPFMELLAAIIISITFLYAYRNSIPASAFLSIGTALYFFFDPLKRLLRLLNEVQRTSGAVERIEQVLNETSDVIEAASPRVLSSAKGTITFRDVTFQYDSTPLFRGLNAEIASGSFCALVGPSGGGKSTFAKLILRFYDANVGTIALDGVDIRALSLHNLRHHIAYVPQHPVLFNDSIANNIRIGRLEATDEEVREAARNAFAHDFIETLAHGYATQVGEDGARLSGGQRQRLALARAFLKGAPILILDEATSALDSESEARIQDALRAYGELRTVIVIAHRLSTIALANQILVFENGAIVGSGTHDHLIETSALYRSLCERQGMAARQGVEP